LETPAGAGGFPYSSIMTRTVITIDGGASGKK